LRTFATINCTENQNIMSEKPRSPRPFKSNSNRKFSGNKRNWSKPSHDDRPNRGEDSHPNKFNTRKDKPFRPADEKRTASSSRYGKSSRPPERASGRAIINYRTDNAFKDEKEKRAKDANFQGRNERKEGTFKRDQNASQPYQAKNSSRANRPISREKKYWDRPAGEGNKEGKQDRRKTKFDSNKDRPFRREKDYRSPSTGHFEKPSYPSSPSFERPGPESNRERPLHKDHPARSASTGRFEKPKYHSSGFSEKKGMKSKLSETRLEWKDKRYSSSARGELKDEKSEIPLAAKSKSVPGNFFSDKLRRNIKSSEKINLKQKSSAENKEIRLNKYIAEHGLCSRREADVFIASGVVSVNGVVITAMGTKVMPGDEIKFNGERLREEKKVYLLLNKPKDYITTLEDPNAKKTVMELIRGACKERIYPVGRLDRNSTGVLLFTNDGELTRKLTHPSFHKKKVYHVFLNKVLKPGDLQKILTGVELEDGIVKADEISYVDEADKSQVGIEIHSGQNRIVRRMFEELGYNVKKLDRVYFAGLTKKGLQRGEWRFLNDKEIRMLITGSYD
jgi:23S rRNA pseudouridine2605 synthase